MKLLTTRPAPRESWRESAGGGLGDDMVKVGVGGGGR